MKVLGIMSGSSLDGLDIALVNFDGIQWELIKHYSVELPVDIKSRLASILSHTPREIAITESTFSRFITDYLKKLSIHTEADLIGIHGHTVLHYPDYSMSWQLVSGGMISAALDMDVVTDFRVQDMALGGQGTPMAVIADRDLFPGYDYYINLGGIANISHPDQGQWQAYDICPCNQILNYYSQILGHSYDAEGSLAREGQVIRSLYEEWYNNPFFIKSPPKSIDNNWITLQFLSSNHEAKHTPHNLLRTSTELIASLIANEISKVGPKVLISGGGAWNKYLISLLEDKLHHQNAEVIIPDKKIVDYKEAILIAYCAYLRKVNRPNFVSNATGADKDVIGGALYSSYSHTPL